MEEYIKGYFNKCKFGNVKEVARIADWDQGKRYRVITKCIIAKAYIVYEKDGKIFNIKRYTKDRGFI